MPLRLIERFDQRWRDTPVKNQQPPVPPLSLCIPLFLYPSLSPSVALSIPSIYIPSSLICPTFPLPLLSLLHLFFYANIYIPRGQSSRLVFHNAPAHSCSPGGCLVVPRGGSSTAGQMALSAP